MARPSSYTPEIAARICAQIASGSNLNRICGGAEDMPDRQTVYNWFQQNPEFFDNYTRARETRADHRFDSIDDIAMELRAGTIDSNQARVLIDAIKWQAGKEAPKRYGDRLELAGDKANPIAVDSTLTVRFVDAKEGE